MYCVVQKCRSVWKPNSSIKFHSFPKDTEKRNTWLSIIPLKGKFYLSAKVCSLHFKPDDYDPERPGNLLSSAAPFYIPHSCYCASTLMKANSIGPSTNIAQQNIRSASINTDNVYRNFTT